MPWLFPIIDRLPLWSLYALFTAGAVCVITGVATWAWLIFCGFEWVRCELQIRRYEAVRRAMRREHAR
jgi:hypothetical protein